MLDRFSSAVFGVHFRSESFELAISRSFWINLHLNREEVAQRGLPPASLVMRH